MASGSELNQVWTNLIDNAADAMNGNGKLEIRVIRENDFILVEIADNGLAFRPTSNHASSILFSLQRASAKARGLALTSLTASSKMSAAKSA